MKTEGLIFTAVSIARSHLLRRLFNRLHHMAKHRKKRQYFTPEQEEIVREHYADTTPQHMEELLDHVFNSIQIGHKAKKLGIRKSQAYREMHGCSETGRRNVGSTPWNKGTTYRAGGRSSLHRFKPGAIPKNRRPVGSTRINVEGYVEIKIAEGNFQWRPLHRENWKKIHGEYPPRGTALTFKDGNKQNCDIDNLELLTRKQLMARNSIQNYPDEIKEVTHLRAIITRKINDHKKQHNGTA